MGKGNWRRGSSRQPVWNDNRGPQQHWVQRRTVRPCQGCELGVLCQGHGYKTEEREKQQRPNQ